VAVATVHSFSVRHLRAYYGKRLAIDGINLDFAVKSVTALMGPSGCGKTTLLRCMNRIHELTPGGRIEGQVLLDGEDVYTSGIRPIELRQRVGMVFQRPNPFPTLSIIANATAGLPQHLKEAERNEIGEKALRASGLWDQVKDRLDRAPASLSGGQQQRLCIARALAVQPEVLLMDEPTSALDPIATMGVEELMTELARDYTIVVVTHNMQQAARVSDFAAFMLAGDDRVGRMVEYDETAKIFKNPKDRRTEDYITGRFG
jgi:phosphate transport system ATP-binding protein